MNPTNPGPSFPHDLTPGGQKGITIVLELLCVLALGNWAEGLYLTMVNGAAGGGQHATLSPLVGLGFFWVAVAGSASKSRAIVLILALMAIEMVAIASVAWVVLSFTNPGPKVAELSGEAAGSSIFACILVNSIWWQSRNRKDKKLTELKAVAAVQAEQIELL